MSEKMPTVSDNNLLSDARRKAEGRLGNLKFVRPIINRFRFTTTRTEKGLDITADNDPSIQPATLQNASDTQTPLLGLFAVSHSGTLPVTLGFSESFANLEADSLLYEVIHHKISLLPEGISSWEQLSELINKDDLAYNYAVAIDDSKQAKYLDIYEDDYRYHYRHNQEPGAEEICIIRAKLKIDSSGTEVIFSVLPRKNLSQSESDGIHQFIGANYSKSLLDSLKKYNFLLEILRITIY